MKKVLFLTMICFGCLAVQAQKMEKKSMKDCVMMEDGKMMVMKDGKTMAMDKDMTMGNGSMVMMDGYVKMKTGKKMKLKDGDCVWMNGSVTHGKMKGDMKKGKM